MLLLIATLAAILSGPLLYAVARRRPTLLAFLDGFVVVSIAGLVALEVVPGAFGEGGAWSAAFLLLGALGPSLVEHLLHNARRETHVAVLVVAVAGLVLHSLGDGAALAPVETHDHSHNGLAMAVAIHSVPVGLAVWWLLYPVFGALLPALALAAMAGGTVLGYVYGIELNEILGAKAWAWFQAVVAGSILHVVFGRPHLDAKAEASAYRPRFEGLGNLSALVALLALQLLDPHADLLGGVAGRFLDLALESAPALLLAYLIGGLIGTEMPDRWLAWMRRGGNGAQALRGMLLGLPLPICSCGVLPLYRSLILRGAPVAAATAFLIATPEVGLTALFVSLPLLGGTMTLIRVGAAALLAVFVAYVLARRFAQTPFYTLAAPAGSPCCDAGHEHEHTHPGGPQEAGGRLRRSLRVGAIDLVDGTMAWILVGLLVAALIAPYVQQLPWAQWPDLIEVAAFALLGLPMYVCAAGATPLVAVLVAAGVSPGAALAFLLTGPATNVATFGVLQGLHGTRFAASFALLTAAGAITLGWSVNALISPMDLALGTPAHAHHGALEWLSLSLLTALFLAALLRRGGRQLFGELFGSLHPSHEKHAH